MQGIPLSYSCLERRGSLLHPIWVGCCLWAMGWTVTSRRGWLLNPGQFCREGGGWGSQHSFQLGIQLEEDGALQGAKQNPRLSYSVLLNFG